MITPHTLKRFAKAGVNATFTCSPSPAMFWRFNDGPLFGNMAVVEPVSSFSMMSVLVVRNVKVNNSGSYQCIGRSVRDKSLFIDEAILEVLPQGSSCYILQKHSKLSDSTTALVSIYQQSKYPLTIHTTALVAIYQQSKYPPTMHTTALAAIYQQSKYPLTIHTTALVAIYQQSKYPLTIHTTALVAIYQQSKYPQPSIRQL